MELILYLLLAFFLMKTPFLGTNLRILNTVIHEFSHIFVAKVTGGKGHSIKLHPDTSGSALVGSSSRWSRILSTYAGYTGSSVVAFGLFYFIDQGKHQLVMIFFLCLVVGTTILWTRNLYGILWSASFAALLYMLFHYQLEQVIFHGSMILSSIILLESILSAAHIMYISMKSPKEAGDAAILQKTTWIPAVFWGLLFFVQALYIGVEIVTRYV
ncbi:M50 family metallopeptidase [Radiobacillus kanasensis]|uniref:M50 family metallopeptidase n=1 Tax=Radiobacillus kanasensis TaxID=2844358 RepID=UPI001E51FD2E|nr:M50 family metallopeptidase [Radiobacillus kanasensis]UFT98667.1 M50 family metallopeptidase [Radiobacillus kanasensis]